MTCTHNVGGRNAELRPIANPTITTSHDAVRQMTKRERLASETRLGLERSKLLRRENYLRTATAREPLPVSLPLEHVRAA